MVLDLTNKRIINELQYNAKIPDIKLAKQFNISREVLSYRIKRLQEQGIIKGFTTIINTAKLGYITFRVFIKMKNMSQEVEENLIENLKNKTAWIVRVRGNWSYNLMLQVKTISEANNFIKEIKNEFSQNIITIKPSIITKIIHKPILYLDQEKKIFKVINLSTEIQENIILDKIDNNIIAELIKNARIPNTEIARKLNLGERVVRYRIKKLEELKIILGYRTTIDYSKLNKNYYKLHLILINKTTEITKKIQKFLLMYKDTAYITETIGGWDIELELIGISQEIYKLIDKIEEQFPNTLQDYEILEYEKEYKIQYL